MVLSKIKSLICWDQRLDKDFDPPRAKSNELIWALSLSLFLTFTAPGLAQENEHWITQSPPVQQTQISVDKINAEIPTSDLHYSVAPRRSWANNKLNGNNHPNHHQLTPEEYNIQQLIYENNQKIAAAFSGVLEDSRMEDMMKSCYKHYKFVDDIAKKLDFPTVLILATFYIENSCELINKNRNWLFQLTSSKKRYKIGKVNLNWFREQIIDFVNYSREKYKGYEDRTWEKIILTYNEYTIKNIKLHWVLFNWWPKWITPHNSDYNVCNISKKNECDKDGLLASITRFAKLFETDFLKKYWLS